jgi:hypothetical protein
VGENAEIWRRSVVGGVGAGLVVALLTGTFTRAPWWLAGTAGGVCAAVGCAVLVRASHAQLRVARQLAGELVTFQQLRQASRASQFGPVPKEPVVYELAVGLAERNLRQAQRNRIWMAAVFAFVAAINLVVLLSGDLWALWRVFAFSLATAASLIGPRLQARRLKRLRNLSPS